MENSSFGRLISVLVSPAKTFASIAERPTWLLGVVVITVLGAVSSVLAFGKIDWGEVARTQLEQSGRLSAEQIEQQVATVSSVSKVFAYVSVVVGPLIAYLVIAAVFFLVLKIVGGGHSFKGTMSTVVHSAMPWALAALLTVPVVLGQESITIEQLQGGMLLSHLGFLAGEDGHPGLRAALSSIDLFSIWNAVLLTIGFAAVARIKRASSAVCVLVMWALYVAGKVGFTMVGQLFS